jgi:hypothetical protein
MYNDETLFSVGLLCLIFIFYELLLYLKFIIVYRLVMHVLALFVQSVMAEI